MINGDTLKALLKSARLGYMQFAAIIQREADVIADWLNDREAAPPYAGLTVSAIKRHLQPATDDQMIAADLVHSLGIETAMATYWKTTRQFPFAARFAISATIYDREAEAPLTSHDFIVLRRIAMSRHFQARNGWRAKPVLGKKLPLMQLATPRRVIGLGLAETIYNRGFKPYLQLTEAGKQRIDKS